MNCHKPILRKDVLDISDLKPGMKLQARSGMLLILAHLWILEFTRTALSISKLADKFVKHPSEVVRVGDRVEVTVCL